MSVFIHKTTKDGTYSYDFQYRGERFSGSTRKTTRREAEKEEQRIKEDVKRAASAEKNLTGSETLTVEQAGALFWDEKRADHKNQGDLLWQLGWLKGFLGATTMLHEIDDRCIARMVAKRRGEFNLNFKSEQRPITKATVNHTTRILMSAMNRARDVWKVRVVPIEWRQHFLKEPQERVREASVEEEESLLANLDRGFDVVVRFVNLTGARRMEVTNLAWTDVRWTAREIVLRGKSDKSRTIPMTNEMFALLWAEKDHHPTKVFTFVATRTRHYHRFSVSYVRGQRYPLTVPMIKYTFKVAKKRAGLVDYRFHDGRHTAATRLLRDSGNLRLVQKMLGHANIKTTTKYAHATMDDLAQAMASMHSKSRDGVRSPVKSPVKERPKAAND